MSNIAVNPDLKGYKFDDFRQDIWGDSFNWDFDRSLDQVIKLVIHHSVTKQEGTPRQQAEFIAQLHKARGWAGIGYHFVIASDGTVLYVGDIGQGRANVAGNNEKVIGICLVGDFTKQLPTAHQILSAHRLCTYFMTQFPALKNINDWDDVWGHKDCVAWAGSEPTQCPSSAWKTDGDNLYSRIKQANYKGYPDWENAKGVSEPVPTPAPDTYSVDLNVKSATVSQDNEKGIVAIEVEGVARKNGGEVAKATKPLTVNFDKPQPQAIPIPDVIADKAQKINLGEHGVLTVQEAINKMTADAESVEKSQEVITKGTQIKNSKNWWWVKYRLWNELFS